MILIRQLPQDILFPAGTANTYKSIPMYNVFDYFCVGFSKPCINTVFKIFALSTCNQSIHELLFGSFIGTLQRSKLEQDDEEYLHYVALLKILFLKYTSRQVNRN